MCYELSDGKCAMRDNFVAISVLGIILKFFASFSKNLTFQLAKYLIHFSLSKQLQKNLRTDTASMEQWGWLTKGHDRPSKRFENVKNTRPQASELDSCDLAIALT